MGRLIMMNRKRPIIRWMIHYSYFFVLAVFFILINQFYRANIPNFYKYAIDHILGFDPQSEVTLSPFFEQIILRPANPLNQLMVLGITIVVVQIIRGLVSLISSYLSASFSETIAYKTRNTLFSHIQDLSYQYHNETETGDLIQRSTSDVEVVRRFVGMQLPEIVQIISLFFFTILAMIRINWKLTLVSITIVPFIFFFAIGFFKKVQAIFTETEEAESRLSTHLQENLTGIRVVKAFAREKYEIERFDELNRTYRNYSEQIIERMAGYWSLSDFFIYCQIISTLIVGAMFVIQDEMSLGSLVAFSSMVHMILWPIRQLGRIIVDFGKSTVAIRRIHEILNEPDEYVGEAATRPPITGKIEINNLSFSFPGSDTPILKNISLTVNPGETLAILGKTGSGKSTLAHLLVRLYDYTEGSIKIDGHEIKEIDKRWLRQHVGIILQEPFLYSRTIFENIGIVAEQPTEDEVVRAAKIAHIHDDILNFEQGYQTMVGERGVTLSGGQRQRIAIARMLVHERPILIFDDSLSAVDTETDMAIRAALSQQKHHVTRIIITHRIATAMEADQIIVLDQGEIVEQGTHEELLKKDGLYKRIWEIQHQLKVDFETQVEGGGLA